MELFWDVTFIVVGLVFLYYGAEWLVQGGSALALRLGIAPLVIGLTVVAFGTSSPEMLVAIQASLQDKGDITVGNALGSNICNIGFVMGVVALIIPLSVQAQVVKREIPIMLAATLLALYFIYDRNISTVEGWILFSLIFVYTIFSLWDASRSKGDPLAEQAEEEVETTKFGVWFEVFLLVGGLVVLGIGADLLVRGSVNVAKVWGVSEAVIGLTVVAIGTSLPELATSIVAAMKKEADLAVGNLVGSCIFNILCIIGLAAVIQPISNVDINWVDLGTMTLVSVLVLPFAWSSMKVERWEGGLFLLIYVVYMGYLFVYRADALAAAA